MTSTEPALWTSAPTTGFSFPMIASAIAMKFSVMGKVMLHLMVIVVDHADWHGFARVCADTVQLIHRQAVLGLYEGVVERAKIALLGA